ncbi:ROK family transcriptional regulator [Leucobacter ruminantium]|uniref:ROK family transcriptional regulator n=1 Tax=Leucobacter ruminantium TaxID=1289170 RepID=A0A939LS48_9MICO|nr:ROK family transcriptional regulator [Leucobacter ruminantium]MBO1803890.1 ROK family transcriptional regulator [Leucobacter ruminantium]
MTSLPATTAALRAANQHRVVRAIREAGPLSQAEIARRTQLAPPTVSGIIRDLVAHGFLHSEAGAGRRGAAVTIAPSAGVVAGVDFGHSHLEVAVADLAGRISRSRSVPLAPDTASGDALRLADSLIDEMLAAAGRTRSELRAVGMAVPSPIGRDGTIDSGMILPGWVGVDARLEAEAVFGCVVLVDNDANLGALAEHALGAGRGHDDLVYIKVGSGVGCGLVLDGRVHRGSLGTAGELGHFTLDEGGPLCRCGSRGCLEAYVGGAALVQQYAQVSGETDVASFVAAALGGDQGARRLIEDAGRQLGRAVSVVVNLLGPGVVVVGGEMSAAGDLLLDEVRASLRRHVLTPIGRDVRVLASTIEGRASCLGSVLLALEAVELPVGEAARDR